jgi:hypothetical protein
VLHVKIGAHFVQSLVAPLVGVVDNCVHRSVGVVVGDVEIVVLVRSLVRIQISVLVNHLHQHRPGGRSVPRAGVEEPNLVVPAVAVAIHVESAARRSGLDLRDHGRVEDGRIAEDLPEQRLALIRRLNTGGEEWGQERRQKRSRDPTET